MNFFRIPFSDPDRKRSFQSIVARADSARDQGRWIEAAEFYEQAIRLDRSKSWAWVQYAHALKESGALKQAVGAYECAAELAPDDADPVLHLAHLLKRLGDKSAIGQFMRLRDLTGDAAIDDEIDRLIDFHQEKPVNQTHALQAENSVTPVPAPSRLTAPRAVPSAPLEPGLYSLRRGVRLVAVDPSGLDRHKVRLIVDGEPVWSGFVSARSTRNDGAALFDIPLSFPDPSAPTESRHVVVETATVGLEPSGGAVDVPYSTRFSGLVLAVDPTPTGCRSKISFSDAEGLTTKPFVRVTLGDGQEVDFLLREAITRKNSRGLVEFECHIEVKCSVDAIDELAFYPMWSRVPLVRAESLRNAALEDRLATEGDFLDGEAAPLIRLDWVKSGVAGGWAALPSAPEAKLVVDILHGDQLLGSGVASRFRPDLAASLGTAGTHAYEVEIAPGLPEGLEVQARVRSPGPAVTSAARAVPAPSPSTLRHQSNAAALLSSLIEPVLPSDPSQQPTVAAIILNRNGAALLRSLFESIVSINTYGALEIVIIDHDSSDDSDAVCKEFGEKLRIKFQKLGYNGSFSSSNNLGVRITNAEFVFFLNNDTVFLEDFLSKIVSHFQRADVKAVGIRLVDRWGSYLDSLLGVPADQHLGVFLRDTSGQPNLYELRASPFSSSINRSVVRVPAVTGAAMLMRRVDFLALGGFDERYFYGHEDVDLCLRIARAGGKILCDNRMPLAHLRGFSRAQAGQRDVNFARTQARNREIVQRTHAREIHRRLRENLLTRSELTAQPVQIVFLVTSLDEDTLAGDVFTAHELGAALAKDLPACDIRFMAPDVQGKIDASGADILISMRDDFDSRHFRNLSTTCHIVYWVRNNFDRFIESENWQHAHDVWYSSEHERVRFQTRTGVPAQLLRIATNLERFSDAQSDPDYACDYCFTGSRWGVHREISVNLVPEAVEGTFRAFGAGWEGDPAFAPYAFGPLRYSEMPRVYASTRIVVDDANHVTVASGSVNSRVFDAIAAGALPMTNGLIGARETFGEALPTYSSAQELHAILSTYLNDEDARQARVSELKAIVGAKHTYAHRARDVVSYLRQAETRQPSVAIKIAAPKRKTRDEWGDFHYAEALRVSLANLGIRSGIYLLDEWDSQVAATADVSLVLRGLNRAKTYAHQINLLWIISHPDKVSVDECRQFDHVFTASEQLTREYRSRGIEASLALQCTDQRRFRPDVEPLADAPDVLFVGNSRGVMRPIVSDAITAGLDINVYGDGWAGLIPGSFVKGTHISNEELPRWYASAGVVLNDHWPSMSEAGLVSNRVFDVLAAGGRCISDKNDGISLAFGSAVQTYSDSADLRERVLATLHGSADDRQARLELASAIGHEHSFDARAAQIAAKINSLMHQSQQADRSHTAAILHPSRRS